jgi:hypothetical protein
MITARLLGGLVATIATRLPAARSPSLAIDFGKPGIDATIVVDRDLDARLGK